MTWLKPTTTISIGLALLTVSLLLVGDLIGVVPNEDRGLVEGRKKFCESLAVQFSIALARDETALISATLATLVERDKDVVSAAIRTANGRFLAESGEHTVNWIDIPLDRSTPTHVQVPIFQGERRWGTVEVAFRDFKGTGLLLGISHSFLPLIIFFTTAGFVAYLLFIRRALRELDPRSVIPERVKSAFDALAEGLVIMDEKQQIILANTTFVDKIELSEDALLGRRLSDLAWAGKTKHKEPEPFPWEVTLAENRRHNGVPMKYESQREGTHTFMVNATPITDSNGAVRGALATFDDLTDLEKKQIELRRTVTQLQRSRKELQDKTVELEYLATRDPLTGCLNRRAFFEKAELLFLEATQTGSEISCIMVDIDHFKSINDRYGHATGDRVIQFVTGELRSNARPDDLVGRYGGEEFCIILPGVDCTAAAAIAERLRARVKSVAQGRFAEPVRITASFGVAALTEGISNPGDLINCADKALYVAKESGRNRVEMIGRVQAGDEHRASEPGLGRTGVEDLVPELALEDNPGPIVVGPSAGVNESPDIEGLQSKIAELEEDLAYAQSVLTQNDGRDTVTELPNRLLFCDRVAQTLARGQRFDRTAAVIVLDIDMFQRINDALGFVVGDQLLKMVAERLLAIFRTTDTVSLLDSNSTDPTVSRTGADEFGILLTDLKDADTVTWIVKRILDAMAQPLEIDGHEIFLTCSLGVSLYPHDSDSAEVLMRNADAARYSAKQRLGRNNYAFYSADLNQSSYKNLWFESQLHHALEQGELSLHYQPKIDLRTGRVASMEALVRWTNPKLGSVSPADFIPVAEHTGLINEIGDWVTRTACGQARQWVDAGFEEVGVAVNLSAMQFRQVNLHERIIEILTDVGLESRLLEVEITESVVMENYDMAIKTLRKLDEAGIHLAVDDFGTGYSSLAYLKHLPLNTLKIDRSFLSDTVPDKQDELIITAIIAMAHSMGLVVVAEGVESTAQKSFLAGLGCDEVQGYLISKAVPEDAVLDLLRRLNGEDPSAETTLMSA
jgi:diguanylate cyclase (GGDEF)-like protein/PAS domain S-box-containing protein